MEQVKKYPLNEVQAIIFQDRKAASDFIESTKDRLHDFHVQTVTAPIIVLFVWNWARINE